MIPYLEHPYLEAGGTRIYAFGIFVAAAVVVGCVLVRRRALRQGMAGAEIAHLLLWVLGFGFLASHLEYLGFSEPWLFARVATLWEQPERWLNLWSGMSAFGGILGGVLGGWWSMRRNQWTSRERWLFLDAVAFSFPFAWSVARFGCYLAHDHPGIITTSWLAVRYPGAPSFDLGLFDCWLALLVCALYLWLDRRARPRGFFFLSFLFLYAPARLLLDNLRVEERFFGLTSGQYGALAAMVVAFFALRALEAQPTGQALAMGRWREERRVED